jgi:CheY-like chemotaxis protein
MKKGLTYRLTEAGHKAWESQDTAIPSEYRRILWLLETEAHTDVVRGCLRQYSDELLYEWLAELEEIGLLEPVETVATYDLDFSVPTVKQAPLLEEDTLRLNQEAEVVEEDLTRRGFYLAKDRLVNRARSEKSPAETVVLVVEDDPDQLALADLRITMAGYTVRVAESVNGLLHSLLEHGTPDALIMDIMLPDGDGFDILAKMRRHPMYALLPVVFLTAKDDPAEIRRGLALGADGYVTKPYSKTIITEAVRRVLRQETR